MGSVSRFEDLVAWQRARALGASVYGLTRGIRSQHDYSFADQLQRAAVSISANIAEGFERGSATDFHRFLTIAKSSCAELRSHLYLAGDVGYGTGELIEQLHRDAEEVGRIIGALRSSVGRRRGSAGDREQ